MKHKFLRSFFAFLSVIAVLVSFAVNIFAADHPGLFSFGSSSDGNYIYTGNTDVSVSLGVSSIDRFDSLDVSISLNPSISLDMVSGEYSSAYFGSVSPSVSDNFDINYYFSYFQSSDNYFISGIVSDHSWFTSQFGVGFSPFSYSNFTVNYLDVTARDFYIYLDPNYDLTVPDYDDYYAESFIYLDSLPSFDFDGAEGTIYYCLAGEEDSANNRQVYNYSLPSDAGTYDRIFTLPYDSSFGGLYSEPTLIYVEYFVFHIPLVGTNFLENVNLTGTYINYNMDYRNIDISSYEEPISPINPGIFRDYTSWLGTAVGGFLDLEIVDGFALGGILMVLIAFMITMWFLKVFAGG